VSLLHRLLMSVLAAGLFFLAASSPAQENKTAAQELQIKKALESSDVVRQRAALVLVPELGLKGPAAAATAHEIELFLKRTGEVENRALGLIAFGKLTPPAGPATAVLKVYLGDDSSRVRQAAGQALVDLIGAATRDKDDKGNVIGGFGRPVVSTSTPSGSPIPSVGAAAGLLGGSAPAVVWMRAWVATTMKEESVWVRFNDDAKAYLPLCAMALKDADNKVKQSGAEGIRIFAQAMVDSLPDPNTSVADTKVIDPFEAKLKWLLLQPALRALNDYVPALSDGMAAASMATRKAATQAAATTTQARSLALANRRYPPDDIPTLVASPPAEDPLESGTRALLPALSRRLDDESADIRLIAMEGFEHEGASAMPYLDVIIRASENPDIFVRWVAARSMGGLFASANKVETARLVAAVAERVTDADIDVRSTALTAMGKAGAAGRPATATVLYIAAHAPGDPDQRVLAITTLTAIDADREQTLAKLPSALRSRAAVVRKAAAAYFGTLGHDARPVLPELKPLLLDDNEEVRREAARAILAID
jgi:HEAT repeat protein